MYKERNVMRKMKAARIFGKKDIRYIDIPVPEIKPDEVLIKVKAVGLCGSDVELYEGTHPYIKRGLTTLPITPGHEWSGIIAEVGANVKGYKPGDRVVGDVSLGCGDCSYCKKGRYNLCPDRIVVGSYKNKDGGFADYLSLPARNLFKIPENISFKEAALIEPAATCVYGIMRIGIDFGSSVLVIGDGPIGQFALQAAYASGAGELIMSGSYDSKIEIASKFGATKTINRHKEDVIEAVMEFTSGQGVDIVIESCGKAKGLEQAIEVVKPGGKLCLFSFYTQEKIEICVNTIVMKNLNIYGSLASPNAYQPTINMLKLGKMNTKEIITHTVPLEKAEEAYNIIYQERDKAIKVILIP